jgi:phosphate transport system substrate-binding protein
MLHVSTRRAACILSVVACAAVLGGCGGGEAASPAPVVVELHGAGASFPAPLYDRWSKDYAAAHPEVRVHYRTVDGAEVAPFTSQLVDFGASDAPLTHDELAAVDRGVQMIPITASSIVLAFNLAEVTSLRLPRRVYADIFLGRITMWNDAAIAAANPGARLPRTPIGVVHRSDRSVTTAVFTEHLSAISPEWEYGPGASPAPQWPIGLGAKGHEGVATTIRQSVGSLGYVDFRSAMQSKLRMAALENRSGAFVEPTAASGQAALAAAQAPGGGHGSLRDPDGKGAYPLVAYSWLLAYRRYDRPGAAAALRGLVRYSLRSGQKSSEDMGYIPLPASVIAANLEAVDAIR